VQERNDVSFVTGNKSMNLSLDLQAKECRKKESIPDYQYRSHNAQNFLEYQIFSLHLESMLACWDCTALKVWILDPRLGETKIDP
jgi:hypothetical protein